MKILALIILFSMPAYAVPSISEISGTTGDGNTLTITGTGFFNHPNSAGSQKPSWFHDFEDGTLGPDSTRGISDSWHSDTYNCVSTTVVSAAEGTYAVRSDIADTCPDTFQEAYIKVKSENGFAFPLSGYLVWSIHRINQADADQSENWKYFRIAHEDGDFYPNTWIGESPDDTPQIYTEECADDDNHQQYFDYDAPDSTWMEDSYFAQRESTNYGIDGYWHSRQDGVITGSNTAWAFNCSAQDTDPHNFLAIEDDISNDREGVSGFAYYDYVYIDTATPVYVMFTDASTLGGSSEFWLQPYTAMSTTEITIEQKFANLGSDPDAIYVYVCEEGNSCSSGVQLSSAGEGGGGGGGSPGESFNDFSGKTILGGKAVLN